MNTEQREKFLARIEKTSNYAHGPAKPLAIYGGLCEIADALRKPLDPEKPLPDGFTLLGHKMATWIELKHALAILDLPIEGFGQALEERMRFKDESAKAVFNILNVLKKWNLPTTAEELDAALNRHLEL